MITYLTMENFEQEVLKAEGTVVVDFYADWCGPCQMQGPIIEQLAEERTDVKFCKLDTDAAAPIAIQYGVSAIPTILVVKDGVEVHKSAGLMMKNELLEVIDK